MTLNGVKGSHQFVGSETSHHFNNIMVIPWCTGLVCFWSDGISKFEIRFCHIVDRYNKSFLNILTETIYNLKLIGQLKKKQSTKCLNVNNVINICTMTKFTYMYKQDNMKQSLKILIFFLCLSYIEMIIVSSMKMHAYF